MENGNSDYRGAINREISEYVQSFTLDYPRSKNVRADKVIHDALWGTQLLRPHEIALIDTPLIQRLRQIRQTALTCFTFPSSVHSRFEHSLGVLYQCNKLIDALMEKYGKDGLITEKERNNIRFSALLHDCGHGPFSHTSEEVYRYCPDMQQLISAEGAFEGKTPHEVLSSLIVSSKEFSEDFVSELDRKYGTNLDALKIADFVIGRAKPTEKYLAEIINGPFDGDKLDYIFRDGHFCGLPLQLDLDRLYYAVEIALKEKDRFLSVSLSGTGPLEQILFCKINLFATVYHHHKVRAVDCMFKGIIEYIHNKTEGIKLGEKIIKFNKATDFLWVTDEIIFGLAYIIADPVLHRMIHDIVYRRLFQRALVISKDTINNKSDSKYQDLLRLNQTHITGQKKLRELAQNILDESGSDCSIEQIWIDMPRSPSSTEADDTFVVRPSSDVNKKEKYVKLTKLFPVDRWVALYTKHKWKGHVFCPPEHVDKISNAAKKVLETKFDIEFNQWAQALCHVDTK